MKQLSQQDLWDYVYSIKNTVIATCLKYVVSRYTDREFKKSDLKIKISSFKFNQCLHLESKDGNFKISYFVKEDEGWFMKLRKTKDQTTVNLLPILLSHNPIDSILKDLTEELDQNPCPYTFIKSNWDKTDLEIFRERHKDNINNLNYTETSAVHSYYQFEYQDKVCYEKHYLFHKEDHSLMNLSIRKQILGSTISGQYFILSHDLYESPLSISHLL